jgi:hypothetical protein
MALPLIWNSKARAEIVSDSGVLGEESVLNWPELRNFIILI